MTWAARIMIHREQLYTLTVPKWMPCGAEQPLKHPSVECTMNFQLALPGEPNKLHQRTEHQSLHYEGRTRKTTACSHYRHLFGLDLLCERICRHIVFCKGDHRSIQKSPVAKTVFAII